MPPSQFDQGNADGSGAALGVAIWRTILLLVWGAWWGGLCFYAIVVVPIGTDVIGSVEQGFITQKVTQWHNTLSWVFLVLWLTESFRHGGKMRWFIAFALAAINIALVVWHSHLTEMMDFQSQTVPSNFYSQHAIYLWITAAEWALGMILPIWICPLSPRTNLLSPGSDP